MKIGITFFSTILAGYIGACLGALCNAVELISILLAVATAASCVVGFVGHKK